MRQTSKDGKTWFEELDGVMQVGFTPSTVAELEECWHIIPASTAVAIKVGQPLLSVETNEGLFSIASPVSGIVTFFNNQAMNMPDQVKPDNVVCSITPEEVVKKKKAAAKIRTIQEELEVMRNEAVWNVPNRVEVHQGNGVGRVRIDAPPARAAQPAPRFAARPVDVWGDPDEARRRQEVALQAPPVPRRGGNR